MPELERLSEVSLVGLDGAEIGGRFKGVGIERESFLVERRRFGEIAALLCGVGESGEESGIVGIFAQCGLEEFLGLRLGHGHAGGDDGLPSKGEVSGVLGGIGRVGEGDEGRKSGGLHVLRRGGS